MTRACLATLLLFSALLAGAERADAVVSQFGEVAFQNTAADLAADPTATPQEQAAPEWIATIQNLYLVTAVGPKHVLGAKHVNSPVGSPVVFLDGPNAGSYTAVALTDDPNSDLRLWEVDGVLSTWSEIYDQLDEVGKGVTIFGNGRAAGPAVILEEALPIVEPFKGWQWGTVDATEWTWGRNVLSGAFGHPTNGALIEMEFDRNGLPRECHLSARDSSGPWFVEDSTGVLKLAAVSSTVLGPFQLPTGGQTFNAMLLDFGGLIFSGTLFPDVPQDFPSNAAGVRLSAKLNWLDAQLTLPDGDADGIPDALDNCPVVANPGQEDDDDDGVGQACDNCGLVANARVDPTFLSSNPWATTTGDQRDDDADGYGNVCDTKMPGVGGTIGSGLDTGELIASLGGFISEDTCGRDAATPCAVFDVNEDSAFIISAFDTNYWVNFLLGQSIGVPGATCPTCPLTCAGDNCAGP